MPEIDEQGLFIVKGSNVTHVHSSGPFGDNLEALREYLDEWDLEVPDDA